MSKILLCLLVNGWIVGRGLAGFMNHKYSIDVENGFLCPDNDQLEIPMTLFHVDRLNRTHRSISLNFTLAEAISDGSVEATVLIERWLSGRWVSVPLMSYQKNPCKYFNMAPQSLFKTFNELANAIGMDNVKRCDIPAGSYGVTNYPLKPELDIPFFPGRFRVSVLLRRIRTQKKVLCATAIVNFIEVV